MLLLLWKKINTLYAYDFAIANTTFRFRYNSFSFLDDPYPYESSLSLNKNQTTIRINSPINLAIFNLAISLQQTYIHNPNWRRIRARLHRARNLQHNPRVSDSHHKTPIPRVTIMSDRTKNIEFVRRSVGQTFSRTIYVGITVARSRRMLHKNRKNYVYQK